MICKECNEKFGVGEMDKSGRCWACAAHVELQAREMDEEEAFATLHTEDLIAMGYLDAATVAEMMAPWSSEVEEYAQAA